MIRLVVYREARRIYGWAFRTGGGQEVFTVELLFGKTVIDRMAANLTLPLRDRFLSNEEHIFHGFEFLIRPNFMLEDLTVHLVEGGKVAPVPQHRGGSLGANNHQLHVDNVGTDSFSGWCWNPDTPDVPCEIELSAPGFSEAFQANQFRIDLVKYGLAGGNCGFHIRWPTSLPVSSRSQAVLHSGPYQILLGVMYSQIHMSDRVCLPRYINSF